MKKLIETQISTLLKEIELIVDNYQRADIRVKLISALSNMTLEEIKEPKGKEAIKNNKKKTPRKVQLEDIEENTQEALSVEQEQLEEDIDEQEIEIKEEQQDVIEKVQPQKEILEEETSQNEPIIIEYIDENNEVQNLDITQAWNVVGDEENSEERIELAKNLTEYNLLPIYETFSNLDHSYNKMMLSYYMQQYSLEDINEFIENLTEGMYNDVYEFVNNSNLEGLIVSIENAIEE